MKKVNTKWMVKVAMLSACAIILMLLEFPLPFIAPPFYEIDFSEIPVLIGAFALGPVAGFTIELIKVLLNLVINGTITGGVGEFANFLMGIFFVVPAGVIYKNNKSKKQAILGMITGAVLMVVSSAFINAYILIPAYGTALNMPLDAFVQMGAKIHPSIDSIFKLALLCVVPFNTLKALLVSVITAIIYKPLKTLLMK